MDNRRSEMTDPAAPGAVLDDFEGRINNAGNRASCVLDVLDTVGDRCFGKPGETAGNAGNASPSSIPDGIVARTYAALDRLDALISRLDNAAARLQGLA